MSLAHFSTRSKVIYWLYGVLVAVSVAYVLALLISLGGYFLAGWESAPVPRMTGLLIAWMLYALIPLLALRFLLFWSLKKDRDRT